MNVQLHQHLVLSACRQTIRAVNQLEADPTAALVEFADAVKRFLLARLALEHWTLIMEEPISKTPLQVRTGDFQPVSLESLFLRLARIAGSPLAPQQQEFFQALRIRAQVARNGLPHDKENFGREAVASTFLRGWFYLQAAEAQWPEYSTQSAYVLGTVADRIRSTRNQLSERIEQEASRHLLRGKRERAGVAQCPACDCHAFMKEPAPETGYCRVCGLEEIIVDLDCQQCKRVQSLIGNGHSQCEHCGVEILPYSVWVSLSSSDALAIEMESPLSFYPPGYCGVCDRADVLARLNEAWLCVECFACHALSQVRVCQKCGETGTNFPHNTELVGCPCCAPGWRQTPSNPNNVDS